MNNTRHLPLYQFFTRIRTELGLNLDIQQYLLMIKIWQEGQIPIQSSSDLLALCKTLWLSRAGSGLQEKFINLFDEELELVCKSYFDSQINHSSKPTLSLEKSDNSQKKEEVEEQEENKYKDSGSKLEKHESEDSPVNKKQIAPLKKRNNHEVSIFIQFKNTDNETSGVRSSVQKREKSESKYIFSDKYFPINSRKLQQNWKYIQKKNKKIPSKAIDIPGSIEKLVQEGGFMNELKYQLHSINYQRVLVLIDYSHSMVAFEHLAEHLVDTLQQSLSNEATTVLYFNNVPVPGYLYSEEGYRVKAPWLSKEAPQLILIISDGGAAKNNEHLGRIEATEKVLMEMKINGSKVIWLNPMPKSRWYSNSAFYLPFQVKMLELTDQEMKQLPTILKRV